MLAIILTTAALLTAIVLIVLNWSKIVSWFQKHEELLEEDKDNIAVGVKQAMADGKVTYVQGIFNKRTNKLGEATKYEAKELDQETLKKHKGNDLIIVS